jgi:hypothetical protein
MKTMRCISVLMGMGLFVVSVTAAYTFDGPNAHRAIVGFHAKFAKVPGADQAKLTQAPNMLDDAVKKHEACNRGASMDEMTDTMKRITANRPECPVLERL